MMRNVFLVLVLFIIQNLYSQDESIIYRNEEQNESSIPQPYNVSVLILKTDGTYEIKYQKYRSKKMMKKNILLYFEKESGSWKKVNDTLILREDKTDQIFKFLINREKELSVIIQGEEIVKSKWKLIN